MCGTWPFNIIIYWKPKWGCPIFLALNGYHGQPVLSLYIYLIFLYHVNQCRVQLGANKVVVVVAASIHYYSTETDIPMDDFLFFIFPPIFEKVVKWGSGSFEFYLLVRVISSWMPFDPGPFKGCYSVTSAEPYWCAKRLNRGKTLKHPFQTDAVASSWLNQSRDDRKSKTRPRNKHQIIRQIKVDNRSEAYMSHRENHEASVTLYVYETWPKIRGPFDGC